MPGLNDFFLKIDGVEGESLDDKHKGEIHILSFSMGASNAASGGTNSGSGVGRALVTDVQITKEIDKSTPNIFINCVSGKHHKTAVISARKAGENPQDYLKITLEEVFLSSYNLVAGAHGGNPKEHFTLNFATIEQEHKVQTAQGALGAANKKKFDVKKNKAT